MRFIALVCMTFVLISCTSIGTVQLPKNRVGFSDAMIVSEEQQLLLNIVRIHFEDRPYFVSVESITTSNSLSLAASPSYSFTDSPTGTASDNLTRTPPSQLLELINKNISSTFSKSSSIALNPSVSYSDSPTISYTPLQGEKFTRNILTPIPIANLTLLLNSGWRPGRIMRVLIEEVGDVLNPSVAFRDTFPEYKPFQELVDLMRILFKNRLIYFETGSIDHIKIADGSTVAVPPTPSLDLIVRRKYKNTPLVRKMYRKLGIKHRPDVIHFIGSRSLATTDTTDELVYLQTRSFGSVLDFLSNGVEFNPETVKAGLVLSPKLPNGEIFNFNNLTKGILHIYVTDRKPNRNVSVAVFFRNHWFYIADDDVESKRTFLLVEQVFNLQSGELPNNNSPVLTIPVNSR